MKFIGECYNNGQHIRLERDSHGKFYIDVDDISKQKRLNAEEMARWFLNAMHNESPSKIHTMDDNTLRQKSDEYLKKGKRIEAIKFVRTYREWSLKEAFDYITTSKHY